MGNSKPVVSNQDAPHSNLLKLLKRRRSAGDYLRKPRQLSKADLLALEGGLQRFSGRLILDSGCGTGLSTRALARENPESFVLGVDKSVHRLEKAKSLANDFSENVLFLRSDLQDLWMILQDSKIALSNHCLFYPNPWPKSCHMKRRVHASAAFPIALTLGGSLIMRTNWEIFAQEFVIAVEFLTGKKARQAVIEPEIPITAFETKYMKSGHSLFEVTIDLNS